MTKVEAVVGNTTYDLSNEITYMHLGNDGFGLPPVDRLSESGPLQDGDTDVGFKLRPRIISLVLGLLTSSDSSYFTKRRELANIFRPRTTPIYLRFTNPDGTVYQIDTHYQNGLGFDSQSRGEFGPYTHKVAIQLKASNPLWYNPTQQVYVYGVGSGASGYTFPLTFPFTFGGSNVNQTQTITYPGDYPTSPTIQIYGPITDAVITNLTTGVLLDFTGTTINSGDYYTIDTRYGHISVTDSSGTNKIDKLVGSSDLTGFTLIANPDSPSGLNDIKVTGSSANATTKVYIRYYENYIAI